MVTRACAERWLDATRVAGIVGVVGASAIFARVGVAQGDKPGAGPGGKPAVAQPVSLASAVPHEFTQPELDLDQDAQTQDKPSSSPSRERQSGADILSKQFSIDLTNVTLKRALDEIVKRSGVAVIYSNDVLPLDRRVSIRGEQITLAAALKQILAGTGTEARVANAGRVVIDRLPSRAPRDSTQRGAGGVTGRVVDSVTERGIAGVTLLIAGTRVASTTREDGSFTLANVAAGTHSLSARLLGYHTRTVAVSVEPDKLTRTTIALPQASATLSEVVTTVTGAQRRAEISNDVFKVDAGKLIETAPVRSVTDLLVAAQVPGMIVTPSSGEPGAPARIRLGGVGSISQNNDPVVIVDGVWIKSAFSDSSIMRSTITQGRRGYLPSRLDAIDPSSIETIEVVRGPAAATLYGPDAANGVIKITTKRGQAGPARWDIRVVRDELSAQKNKPVSYLGYGHEFGSSAPMQCSIIFINQGTCTSDSVVTINPNVPLLLNEGRGTTNGVTMTVSGGVSQIRYSLTGSMQDQIGVRRMTMADQVRLRQLAIPVSSQFRTPTKLSDRSFSSSMTIAPSPTLDITMNLSGTQRNSRSNDMRVMMTSSDIRNQGDTISTLFTPVTVNPIRGYTTITQGLANAVANWNPRPWWSGNVTVGIDRGYTLEKAEDRTLSCGGGNCNASPLNRQSVEKQYSIYTARLSSTLFPNLGWASRFLSIRPGVSMDLRREIEHGSRVTTLFGGAPMPVRTDALGGIGVNTYIKLFDRLSFDPAIRRDFGSARNLRNNAKTYPRFGTSWLMSDESFFPKTPWVTSFRLRAAFGYAAVQPDRAAVRGRYVRRDVVANGQTSSMIVFETIGNSHLEPERSVELESGFDVDLFGDRATLIVTHANKQNKNTLINRTPPPSSGTTASRQENLAQVVNRRTEIQLTTRVIERPGLSARVTANLSIYDNRIKTLGDGVSAFGPNEQRYVAGYPVGALWMRPILGVNDVNGDGRLENSEIVVGDSVVYVGSQSPRYTAGYNLEVTVFNLWTVNALIGYKGKYMQNRNQNVNAMRGYWDPRSSLADQALIHAVNSAGFSDLQSLSEVRLQSASVTMNVPTRLAQKFRARTMQVSLQGSNLGLWTQYRGRDPGVNSSPVGERVTDDGSVIAPPRGFSLQLRLGY